MDGGVDLVGGEAARGTRLTPASTSIPRSVTSRSAGSRPGSWRSSTPRCAGAVFVAMVGPRWSTVWTVHMIVGRFGTAIHRADRRPVAFPTMTAPRLAAP